MVMVVLTEVAVVALINVAIVSVNTIVGVVVVVGINIIKRAGRRGAPSQRGGRR